jgi:hypothetical protein
VIAYFDVQAGRIPVFFMFAALLLGFAFGLSNGRGCINPEWVIQPGVSDASFIGLDKIMQSMQFQKHPNIAAFSMGDA